VSRPGKTVLTSGFADEFGSLRTNGSPFRHPSRTGAQSKTVGEGPCSIRYNCTQLLAIVGAGRHSRQVSVDQEVTRAMNTSRRRYHSAIRQEHAEHTRVRIRDAARRLFSKHGFAGTTVRAIAQEAGVAEPTVYAVYGSKSTIFTALMEALEAEAGIEELNAQLAECAGDPMRQLDLVIAFDCRIFGLADGLVEAALRAGSAAPDLVAFASRGRSQNRAGKLDIARSLAERGLLQPGLTADEAADIGATLSSHEVYRLLVVDSGWSAERFESWLRTTMRQQLVGRPG
jgi:TetR/AcrR family transcriptional regulator, regulator of cefoperazone and chloramphenicol sensitivity